MKKIIQGLVCIVFFLVVQQLYAAEVKRAPNSDAAMSEAVLKYINQYRGSRDLKPLKMNPFASEQARKHSLEMAEHKLSFGHEGFNKRIERLYKEIKGCQAGAENIAYNYKTAKIVVEQWLTSPGHKRNIVGNYNITGIGIARDKQGKLYYTQIFLRSSDPRYVG